MDKELLKTIKARQANGKQDSKRRFRHGPSMVKVRPQQNYSRTPCGSLQKSL